jgi:ADP-ribose pyrophosphatase
MSMWTFVERTEVLTTRIFRVFKERWTSPRTGQGHDFTLIDSPDWVNVLALDEQDNAIMIRQFRLGPRKLVLEVPGGMVDPGESPLHAAARELREETGYVAESIEPLGFVEPNPAIMNNRLHMFLATGCRSTGELELDAGEDIVVAPMPLSEVLGMLHRGQIQHALVANILHRFELLRDGLLELGGEDAPERR